MKWRVSEKAVRGKSEGIYQLLGPVEVQDICDLIDYKVRYVN